MTMGEELVAVLSCIFSGIKFICILTNKNTIDSFFNYKDRHPKCLRAYIVYKFVCPRCGSTLGVRVREHAGVSVHTGQPLSQPPQSAIRDHVIACSTPNSLNLENFSILGMTNYI